MANHCGDPGDVCSAEKITAASYNAGRLLEAAALRGNPDVAECFGFVALRLEELVDLYLDDTPSADPAQVRRAYELGLNTGLDGLPPSAALLFDDFLHYNDYHKDVQVFAQEVMGVRGEETWYRCRHPEFRAELGITDILVTGSVIAELGQGDGVTCDEFYDNEASAKARACFIKTYDPAVVWAIWVGGEAGIGPIFCA